LDAVPAPQFAAPSNQENVMSVAKITEITSTSKSGFDDAVANGIRRASKTIHGITGAWVADQEVVVKSGKIVEYKVRLKLTFVLDDRK
jgi:flavin-binding protein dodecin